MAIAGFPFLERAALPRSFLPDLGCYRLFAEAAYRGGFLLVTIISYMGFLAWRNTNLLSVVAPALILDYGQPILESSFPYWSPQKTTSKILGRR